MSLTFSNPTTQRIVGFLTGIGIRVEKRQLSDDTFLSGITFDSGILAVDEAKLTYSGDLLHEARHLAVTPSQQRNRLSNNVGDHLGREMAAIAWSYAAAVFLELPMNVLFHPDGYKGESETLIENFTNGHYFGVPVLQWLGMTHVSDSGEEASSLCYPRMTKWLCV